MRSASLGMPKVAVSGVSLFYAEAGPDRAEPLVLIMGWGGDHTAWALQAPAFAAEYRVVALDNRGAGQSDAPDVPWTIADMAADTLGLLDCLGIGQAHICGASMGGMIAQEIALGAPERVLTAGFPKDDGGKSRVPPALDRAGGRLPVPDEPRGADAPGPSSS